MCKLTFKKLDTTLNFELKQGVTDTQTIEKVDNGYIVTRKIKNDTDNIVKLTELKAELTIDFNANSLNDYFYVNENARIYGSNTIPVDYDRENLDNPLNDRFTLKADTFWADPKVVSKRILSSPYQPFPAILLSNYEIDNGLIIGTLSQDVFYHNYEVCHQDGKIKLSIFSSLKDIAYRELKPNEWLTDIWCVVEKQNAKDINGIFNEYTSVLRKYLNNNAGSGEQNRHTLIWDSWNDGIYRDVSEQMLIEEAKAVKKYFPNVEYFQLDDGYSSYCVDDVDYDAHGLGVAYEGEDGIDKKKFPNGLKGYTDKIKEIGLKPAIWIGGFCPVKTKIYKECKDWFIDYSYRIDWTQPLDVSKKEVREYMTFALDKLLVEGGFDGIKHDFWSYAFEDKHDLLANKDKSGYEWREWWQSEIRKRVPNGYMETGCDISMGNPFIGKYFNNYRFGLDVGAGKWSNLKTVMFWAVSMLSNHTGDLFIPNSDSIGLLPSLTDVDFMFIVNFQIITRTLVEISGRFSKVGEDNKRLKVIQKAVKYLNNGENVYFANYDYTKTGMNLPSIIYIKSLYDTPNSLGQEVRTVALFNADEKQKEIEFTVRDLSLNGEKYIFENVWTGEKVQTDTISITLEPHGSRLYKVTK